MSVRRVVIGIRWVARGWALASLGLLAAFLLGEEVPPITMKAVFFPFGVMVGLAVAWRFERVGGGVAVASLLLFYMLEFADQGRVPKGPWFILLAAPGALFFLCGCVRGKA